MLPSLERPEEAISSADTVKHNNKTQMRHQHHILIHISLSKVNGKVCAKNGCSNFTSVGGKVNQHILSDRFTIAPLKTEERVCLDRPC